MGARYTTFTIKTHHTRFPTGNLYMTYDLDNTLLATRAEVVEHRVREVEAAQQIIRL